MDEAAAFRRRPTVAMGVVEPTPTIAPTPSLHKCLDLQRCVQNGALQQLVPQIPDE